MPKASPKLDPATLRWVSGCVRRRAALLRKIAKRQRTEQAAALYASGADECDAIAELCSVTGRIERAAKRAKP